MTNLERYVLVALIVVAVSEFAPQAVNYVLVLVLVGVILIDYPSYVALLQTLGSPKK